MCGLIIRGTFLRIDEHTYEIILPRESDLNEVVKQIVEHIDSALCLYEVDVKNSYLCFVNGFAIRIKLEDEEMKCSVMTATTLEDINRVAKLIGRDEEASYIGVGSA